MSIKDVDAFKKVCIENGYEFMSFNRMKEMFKDDEDYNEDSIKLNMERFVVYTKNNVRGLYSPENNVFSFQFSRTNVFDMVVDNLYDKLLEYVKKNCKYYKIITSPNGNDYVSYSV